MSKKSAALFFLSTFFTTVFCQSSGSKHIESSTDNYKIPPPYYIDKKSDDYVFFFGADYTFWIPYQEMPPVLTQTSPSNEAGTTFYTKMGGSSGFKAHIGAKTNFDEFVINLEYTFFINQSRLIASEINQGASYNYVNMNGDTIIKSYGYSSQFKNQFNRISVALHKSFYSGFYTVLDSWVGLLFPWSYNTLNINQTVALSPDQTLYSHINQKWSGAGPYSGLHATYFIDDQWGLYSSAGCALLLSKLNYYQDQVINQTNQESFSLLSVVPMAEATIGITWNAIYPKLALNTHICWDMQTYFNQLVFFANDQRTSYALQGFTAGLSLLF